MYTKIERLELVLSRLPANFTLHPEVVNRTVATRETRDEFLERMDVAIQRAYGELEAMQERYKRNFHKRVRRVNRRLRAGDYVYSNPFDKSKKLPKVQIPTKRPYRVISADHRTIYIEREQLVEQVSANCALCAFRHFKRTLLVTLARCNRHSRKFVTTTMKTRNTVCRGMTARASP